MRGRNGMLSIKSKITLAYTLAFGILLTVFAIVIYEGIADAEIAKLDARIESHSDKLQTELEEVHLQPGFPNRSELDSITTDGLRDARIRLLTTNKRIIFSDRGFDLDSLMEWNAGSSLVPHKTIAKWKHHKYRVLQSPVEIDNRIQYVIQVAAPMHDLDETLGRLRILFWLAIPAVLLLAGIIAVLITRLAFKPMMSMVRTAEKITASNLDARLELPKAHDEVYTLGSALNEMIERIDTTLKGQRQFIADASHELRTPLTIIRSELELVIRSSRHSATKKSVQISLTELDHLASMITNLLTLARLDGSQVTLKVSPVRMDELIIECVQAVRGIATSKGVRLKVFVEEALEVHGDEEKLKSVIFNLLENAVKYSMKKGIVTVSLALNKTTKAAALTVGDHGIGIPASERDRIFERFFRGAQPRSSSDGSGLGLAIVKRFVEMHKGRISVQSEEKKGSVFTVEIPLGDPHT